MHEYEGTVLIETKYCFGLYASCLLTGTALAFVLTSCPVLLFVMAMSICLGFCPGSALVL